MVRRVPDFTSPADDDAFSPARPRAGPHVRLGVVALPARRQLSALIAVDTRPAWQTSLTNSSRRPSGRNDRVSNVIDLVPQRRRSGVNDLSPRRDESRVLRGAYSLCGKVSESRVRRPAHSCARFSPEPGRPTPGWNRRHHILSSQRDAVVAVRRSGEPRRTRRRRLAGEAGGQRKRPHHCEESHQESTAGGEGVHTPYPPDSSTTLIEPEMSRRSGAIGRLPVVTSSTSGKRTASF